MLRQTSHLLYTRPFIYLTQFCSQNPRSFAENTWGSEKMQMRLGLWFSRFQSVNSEKRRTMISGKRFSLGEAKMTEIEDRLLEQTQASCSRRLCRARPIG